MVASLSLDGQQVIKNLQRPSFVVRDWAEGQDIFHLAVWAIVQLDATSQKKWHRHLNRTLGTRYTANPVRTNLRCVRTPQPLARFNTSLATLEHLQWWPCSLTAGWADFHQWPALVALFTNFRASNVGVWFGVEVSHLGPEAPSITDAEQVMWDVVVSTYAGWPLRTKEMEQATTPKSKDQNAEIRITRFQDRNDCVDIVEPTESTRLTRLAWKISESQLRGGNRVYWVYYKAVAVSVVVQEWDKTCWKKAGAANRPLHTTQKCLCIDQTNLWLILCGAPQVCATNLRSAQGERITQGAWSGYKIWKLISCWHLLTLPIWLAIWRSETVSIMPKTDKAQWHRRSIQACHWSTTGLGCQAKPLQSFVATDEKSDTSSLSSFLMPFVHRFPTSMPNLERGSRFHKISRVPSRCKRQALSSFCALLFSVAKERQRQMHRLHQLRGCPCCAKNLWPFTMWRLETAGTAAQIRCWTHLMEHMEHMERTGRSDTCWTFCASAKGITRGVSWGEVGLGPWTVWMTFWMTFLSRSLESSSHDWSAPERPPARPCWIQAPLSFQHEPRVKCVETLGVIAKTWFASRELTISTVFADAKSQISTCSTPKDWKLGVFKRPTWL